jgi:hypothetical protein
MEYQSEGENKIEKVVLTDWFRTVLNKRTRGGEQNRCIVRPPMRIHDLLDNCLGKVVPRLL